MSTTSEKPAEPMSFRERHEQERQRIAELEIQQKRLGQLAADVFASDAGKELLKHLVDRFDVMGRTFIPTPERGDVNALRAAVRDGERAAVMHLVRLIRIGNSDFPIPL